MTLVCEVTFILSQLKYFCQSNVGVAQKIFNRVAYHCPPQFVTPTTTGVSFFYAL